MTAARLPARRASDPVLYGQLLLPLVLLAIWQVVGMLAGDFYVATPVQAADAVADGVSGGWFFDSLGATLAATALGFAIAAVAGLWIGVTLGLVRFWGNVFEPITLSVYSIPKVTLFPIFLTIFGFGLYSKIAFGMFHGIFPIVIIAMSATREVNPVHLKVARSLRLSRTATFRQIIFPAIFPSLLTGLRLGFSLVLLGVVLGEMFASRAGFGYELVEAITLHDTPRMYGIIAVLVVIAFVVNALFLRWEHAAARKAEPAGDLRGAEDRVERRLLRLQRGGRLDVLLDDELLAVGLLEHEEVAERRIVDDRLDLADEHHDAVARDLSAVLVLAGARFTRTSIETPLRRSALIGFGVSSRRGWLVSESAKSSGPGTACRAFRRSWDEHLGDVMEVSAELSTGSSGSARSRRGRAVGAGGFHSTRRAA